MQLIVNNKWSIKFSKYCCLINGFDGCFQIWKITDIFVFLILDNYFGCCIDAHYSLSFNSISFTKWVFFHKFNILIGIDFLLLNLCIPSQYLFWRETFIYLFEFLIFMMNFRKKRLKLELFNSLLLLRFIVVFLNYFFKIMSQMMFLRKTLFW